MAQILDWKSIGPILATSMFLRSAIRDFLPPEVYNALKRVCSYVLSIISPKLFTILIEEFVSANNNEVYESVQYYLNSKCLSSTRNLKLTKSRNSKHLTYTMLANQQTIDKFNGFKLKWSFYTVENQSTINGYTRSNENRYYKLSFHPKHKEIVHSSYIPHVMKQGATLKNKNRERRLYTNQPDGSGRLWSSVPFLHPSTFDTVAMNPTLTKEIKDDLSKFVSQREFYKRVGRAWKRGYLLYGPPGTGKTSLIAAIANFLEFDIYDVELTAVTDNSQLRKLLIGTSSKSVIVIEDVDCTLDLSDRKKGKGASEDGGSRRSSAVSLSGVLNFIDGLWSSCGGERLMIFTTNHKENLDAALLRPGRMDKHINLSYCEYSAFNILMKNYLYTQEHELMKEVEKTLPLVKITPADIAEVFMGCNLDANLSMRKLVEEIMKRLKLSLEGERKDEEIKNLLKVSQEEEEHKEDLEKAPAERDGGVRAQFPESRSEALQII